MNSTCTKSISVTILKGFFIFLKYQKNTHHPNIFTCGTSPKQNAWQYLAVTAAHCSVGGCSELCIVGVSQKTEPWRIRNGNDRRKSVRI